MPIKRLGTVRFVDVEGSDCGKNIYRGKTGNTLDLGRQDVAPNAPLSATKIIQNMHRGRTWALCTPPPWYSAQDGSSKVGSMLWVNRPFEPSTISSIDSGHCRRSSVRLSPCNTASVKTKHRSRNNLFIKQI